MKRVGYLTKKTSKGKVYLYIRKSYREGKRVKHQYIYGFGPIETAKEKLYKIFEEEIEFPKELKINGFNLDDVYDWILTLETGVTKSGRLFDIGCFRK
ncbi:hypothetical protein [Niallia circulans]|uniref:hypothetical protein n=1 Tax=Niallia circulans TaxID=1397 RepID=UPI001560EA88|nr:hypothetical protein [Niallia circulans]NRG31727.1 hypothetical protein [Niallia circulans]